jgi:hypothetical protein
MNEEGKLETKLLKRGIILQRRDNCKILRDTYQALIFKIFDHHDTLVKLKKETLAREAERNAELLPLKPQLDALERQMKADLDELAAEAASSSMKPATFKRRAKIIKDRFKAEKAILEAPVGARRLRDRRAIYDHPVVKEALNMVTFAIDSLFQWKFTYKDFVITKQITREFREYKNPSKLPGHVQLGLKMRDRGIPVGAGTRVEYLILKLKSYKKSDRQKDRLEDAGYFAEFREVLRLEYLAYLKQFITPIDELCSVVFGVEDFVKDQFDIRIKHSRVIDRITDLGRPRIQFVDPPRNASLVFNDGDAEAGS